MHESRPIGRGRSAGGKLGAWARLAGHRHRNGPPRVPSNWSRRFKNHQEKLKSGDVYQVAEVVRNLAARNRDASLSAAERTMYERARVNLISEIAPALKVSSEDAEAYLDDALAKGVLKAEKAEKKVAKK